MESFSKIFVLLAIIATATAAATSSVSISQKGGVGLFQEGRGVVSNLTRCGGYGTPIELRLSGCEGRCSLMPGTRYDLQWEFIPSSASPSLSIACDLVFAGTPLRLFEAIIPNSSVQPGLIYTVNFSIVPNDVLSGQAVILRGIIYHTGNRLLEVCAQSEVDILELP